MIVGLYIIAQRSGVREYLTIDKIRQTMEGAGALGVLLSLGLYAIRDPLRIPALVLNLAMVVAYGRLWGGVMAFVGTNLSVNVCFLIVRGIGGKGVGTLDHPRLQRMLALLDTRPILTVFLTRHVFMASSVYNCALAMSAIRFRHYMIGSLLGLLLPVTLTVITFDWLITFFQ